MATRRPRIKSVGWNRYNEALVVEALQETANQRVEPVIPCIVCGIDHDHDGYPLEAYRTALRRHVRFEGR